MWTKLVTNIIFGKQEYCRLCFSEVDDGDLRFNDEVILNMKTETVSNMLTQVLGGKYTSNMSVQDSFCYNCIMSVKNSYNFIKMCKKNSDCLVNLLDTLNESLKNTDVKISKSVLIHIDSTDYSFMQFYQYRRSVRNLPASLTHGHSKFLIANRSSLKDQEKIPETLDSSNSKAAEQTTEKQNISNLEVQHSKLKTLIQKKDSKGSQTLIQKKDSKGSRRHILKMNINSSKSVTTSRKQKIETKSEENKEETKPQENKKVLRERKPKILDPIYIEPKANILRKVIKREVKCADCDQNFTCASSLTIHIQRRHSKERPFVCKYCDMRFKVPVDLRIHIRRTHLEPCAQCDICDAKFRELSGVYNHRKRHFNPKSSLYVPGLLPPDDNEEAKS